MKENMLASPQRPCTRAGTKTGTTLLCGRQQMSLECTGKLIAAGPLDAMLINVRPSPCTCGSALRSTFRVLTLTIAD